MASPQNSHIYLGSAAGLQARPFGRKFVELQAISDISMCIERRAMATTEKLLTAEEFERLPDDGKRYELIDGELREMAPTVNWHGEVESKLVVRLGSHVEAQRLGIVSCGETLYIVRRNPDRVRAADIAFIRQERVPSLEAQQHIMEVSPDLVIEILSKSDTVEEISDKI